MSGCGALVHTEDGKVTKIVGDPDHPQNRGRLCIKGLTCDELVYHPSRIKHPMKRVGDRGEGKWIEISRDRAPDEIAKKFNNIRLDHGPEDITLGFGTYPKGGVIPTTRLLSLLIAITGNFDVREGNGVVQYPIASYLEMSSKILRADRGIEKKQIGAAEYPLSGKVLEEYPLDPIDGAGTIRGVPCRIDRE